MFDHVSVSWFSTSTDTIDQDAGAIPHVNRARKRRRANKNVRFKVDKEVHTPHTVDVILSDLLDAVKGIQQLTQKHLSEEISELKDQSTYMALVTKYVCFLDAENAYVQLKVTGSFEESMVCYSRYLQCDRLSFENIYLKVW